MNTILISYDLNKAGKDYGHTISYIKSLGPWARPLRSQWLVKTNMSVMDIVRGLRLRGVDEDDSLFVIDVTSRPAAWSNLSPDVSTWVKVEL